MTPMLLIFVVSRHLVLDSAFAGSRMRFLPILLLMESSVTATPALFHPILIFSAYALRMGDRSAVQHTPAHIPGALR